MTFDDTFLNNFKGFYKQSDEKQHEIFSLMTPHIQDRDKLLAEHLGCGAQDVYLIRLMLFIQENNCPTDINTNNKNIIEIANKIHPQSYRSKK